MLMKVWSSLAAAAGAQGPPVHHNQDSSGRTVSQEADAHIGGEEQNCAREKRGDDRVRGIKEFLVWDTYKYSGAIAEQSAYSDSGPARFPDSGMNSP